MGRARKGNTGNESRNLWKFHPDWAVDTCTSPVVLTTVSIGGQTSTESLRSQNTPTTFTEASLLSKSWYAKRSCVDTSTPLLSVAGVQQLSNARNSSCSSSGSVCNINAATPEGPISPSLSPMSQIDPEVEGDMSVKLLTLTVDPEKPTSNEYSVFNKGATAFLNIVEKSLTANANKDLKFDQLVLQMLNLEVNDRICTASDIPDV